MPFFVTRGLGVWPFSSPPKTESRAFIRRSNEGSYRAKGECVGGCTGPMGHLFDDAPTVHCDEEDKLFEQTTQSMTARPDGPIGDGDIGRKATLRFPISNPMAPSPMGSDLCLRSLAIALRLLRCI